LRGANASKHAPRNVINGQAHESRAFLNRTSVGDKQQPTFLA